MSCNTVVRRKNKKQILRKFSMMCCSQVLGATATGTMTLVIGYAAPNTLPFGRYVNELRNSHIFAWSGYAA